MSALTPVIALSSSDLLMLNGILSDAGYRGTEAEVDADTLSDAARFLVNLFQSGVTSEAELVATLNKRGISPGDGDNTPTQIRDEAMDRWRDEGGS